MITTVSLSEAFPVASHAVSILVFDEVEALDFGGPYEVFTTASRMHQRLHPGAWQRISWPPRP